LKTPLNVAVLNLELLRMRIAKLLAEKGDAKIEGYTNAIETELRRMARIFDTFFLLSTPPRGEEPPGDVDLTPLCRHAASMAGYRIDIHAPALTRAHESRIRQALQMFFEGIANILKADTREVAVERTKHRLHLTVSGQPQADSFELTKIFKFYYTDADGKPDLALAATRLIVETYGGELKAAQERDKVSIRLSFPLGE
jgi:nitrogen fixation/metabolism regulation signal transduction histidine kinase